MKEKKDKELIMKHDGVLNFPIDKTGDYKREANFPSSSPVLLFHVNGID